ncbi:hypothetical protein [Blautia phage Montmirail]|nr:hypothetical protein [Blautia phage Montmirail]
MCTECCVASGIIPRGKQSPFGVPPNTFLKRSVEIWGV